MTIAMVTQRLQVARRTKLYDLLAASPLIAWYAICAAHMLPQVSRQVALVRLFFQTDPFATPAGLLLSTSAHISTMVFFGVLVVMFAVRRVPQQTGTYIYARCVAVAGTLLGIGMVLLPPQELSSTVYLISLILILTGTVIAIWASLALGRSISILPQARRLVTRGPYAFVRHPLYLGEIVAIIGVALQYLSIWAILLAGLQCALQLQRMGYEERILLQVFPEYGDYERRTARLIPRVY
jgi:protein-S-isoprenylcysteine O-methyltransferase Ste14